MKTLHKFILFLIIITSLGETNAQSRNKLLNEINTYINNEYRETTYTCNDSLLITTISTYFSKRNYILDSTEQNSLYFRKNIDYPYKLFSSNTQFNSYERLVLYAEVNIIDTSNGGCYLDVITSKKNIPSQVTNRRLLGTRYKINKQDFYKYIYNQLSDKKIILPNNLIKKIQTYNSKQNKEEKKIIIENSY